MLQAREHGQWIVWGRRGGVVCSGYTGVARQARVGAVVGVFGQFSAGCALCVWCSALLDGLKDRAVVLPAWPVVVLAREDEVAKVWGICTLTVIGAVVGLLIEAAIMVCRGSGKVSAACVFRPWGWGPWLRCGVVCWTSALFYRDWHHGTEHTPSVRLRGLGRGSKKKSLAQILDYEQLFRRV